MTDVAGRAVRVGVVGVGALGQHHARIYAALEGATLVGVHDADAGRAAEVAGRYGTTAFSDIQALVDATDALSVAVPTLDHHRIGRLALEAGRDVLLEKPMTVTLDEAADLIEVARERRGILQVGH